jgi:hypothetical protein
MGDKLIQGKTLLLRDAIYIATLLISCVVTYMTTAGKAEDALSLAQENKAFGMAREKMIIEVEKTSREYARDYAYRKDAEIILDVKKNIESIHAIREDMVEAKVERSHLEKNQERILTLLEQIKNKH